MKKFLSLSLLSTPLMAHDSLLPHNHAVDGMQLTSVVAIILVGLALFAVLKKTT